MSLQFILHFKNISFHKIIQLTLSIYIFLITFYSMHYHPFICFLLITTFIFIYIYFFYPYYSLFNPFPPFLFIVFVHPMHHFPRAFFRRISLPHSFILQALNHWKQIALAWAKGFWIWMVESIPWWQNGMEALYCYRYLWHRQVFHKQFFVCFGVRGTKDSADRKKCVLKRLPLFD